MNPGTPGGGSPGAPGAVEVGLVARVVGGLVDVVWEVTELVAAAVGGAVRGAAAAVVQVWVADRPRRQRVRSARRRRWWRRGGWRRALVAAEVVTVLSVLTAVTATRVVLASAQVAAAAGRGARRGWVGRRPTAQARTQARRAHRWHDPANGWPGPASGPASGFASSPASEPAGAPPFGAPFGGPANVRVDVIDEPVDVVLGEIVCGVVDEASGVSCPTTLNPGEIACARHQQQQSHTPADETSAAVGDAELVVDVELVDETAGGQGESGPDGSGLGESPTRRVDGRPETDADRRFFDLRQAGYRGWIDHDGNAVSQSPDGRPAGGSAQQESQQERRGPLEEEEQMEHTVGSTGTSTVTATRDGQPVAQVRVGGGMASSTGLGGELAHIDDLDVEAATVAGVIEQAQQLAEVLQVWQRQLPERSAAAIGSTQGIETAVAGVREAPSTAQLREALSALRGEIEAAHTVGDGLSAAGVSGDLAGITPR